MTTHHTSLELSIRLREIGVPQESEVYWIQPPYVNSLARLSMEMNFPKDLNPRCVYSAYSFSELWALLKERLPAGHIIHLSLGQWIEWFVQFDYENAEGRHSIQLSDNIANDLGLMLEYLVKEGVIKL